MLEVFIKAAETPHVYTSGVRGQRGSVGKVEGL